MNPEDLKYSKDHVWVRIEGNIATVGLTDYAQGKLGEVLAVELPVVGAELDASSEMGSVDCVKTASSVYMPVSGKVIEVNEELIDNPGAINEDPYGAGWIARIEISDPGQLESLMDAKSYEEFTSTLAG